MSLLTHLKLTATSKPDDRIKGHIVILELNAVDYEADKGRFTAIKLQLATEASRDENIVKWAGVATTG